MTSKSSHSHPWIAPRWEKRASGEALRSTVWCRSVTPASWAKTISFALRRDSREAAVLEKNVLLAGQVGISGHLTIHENAIVYAQSGVGGDVPAGARISGSPAFDSREWLRAVTAFPKLPRTVAYDAPIGKARHQLESAARLEGTA